MDPHRLMLLMAHLLWQYGVLGEIRLGSIKALDQFSSSGPNEAQNRFESPSGNNKGRGSSSNFNNGIGPIKRGVTHNENWLSQRRPINQWETRNSEKSIQSQSALARNIWTKSDQGLPGSAKKAERRKNKRDLRPDNEPSLPIGSGEPPKFGQKFEARMRIRDLDSQESFQLFEQILDDSVTLKLNQTSPSQWDREMDQGAGKRNHICAYSRASGLGHKISGILCEPTVNLPNKCFDLSSAPSSKELQLIPLVDLLQSISNLGSNYSSSTLGYEKFHIWNVFLQNIRIQGTFIERFGQITPFSIRITKTASTGMATQSPLASFRASTGFQVASNTEYTILSFESMSSETEAEVRRQAAWSPAPPGVFCPRPDIYRRQLPDIPEHFATTIETVDEGDSIVSYSHQSYDYDNNIVSMKFSPRPHNVQRPIFFIRVPSIYGDFGESSRAFTVIHDFNTGLQYTINKRNGNCSIQDIPMASPDLELTESAHIRLKHAKDLLDVDPMQFMYSGERKLRGVTCDVWVGEESTSLGYQTTELLFLRRDWNIFIEEVNAHQEVPMGIRTCYGSNRTDGAFDYCLMSHFIEFNPSKPSWRDFDISTCVHPSKRLFLKVTIDVTYSQLIQFNLQTSKDSIKSAVAKLCKVSPLRIMDIHLSSSRDHESGIDVWFVLLEDVRVAPTDITDIEAHLKAPKNTFPKSRMNANMADAYRNLALALSQRDIPMKLKVADERELMVHIKSKSLQISSSETHPGANSMRRVGSAHNFLRANYTAGSMAGLGFSMAIFGISVGIFLGFLLWKRRIGMVPYYLQS